MLPTVVMALLSLIKYTVKVHSKAILSFIFKQRFKASHRGGNQYRKPLRDFAHAGNTAGCTTHSCNSCLEEGTKTLAFASQRLGFHNNMIGKIKSTVK